MTPDQLEALFDRFAALDPAERDAALTREPLDDESRCALRTLLAAHERNRDDGFLAHPVPADIDASWVGRTIGGRYRLTALIGEGGQGCVFVAEQDDGPTVAVKLLHPHTAIPSRVQRFRQEREALTRLRHPHIVPLLDSGEDPTHGVPYFVMPHYPLGSLADRANGRPLPSAEAETFTRQIAEAIAHAHRQGFAHRDLKPQNVLVEDARHVRVADFGLAGFLTANPLDGLSASGFGTLGYLPPETWPSARSDADKSRDIFGLGAILFFLVTGRPPWLRDQLAVVNGVPRIPALRELAPDTPAKLVTVCERCLAVRPEQRFPSADDVLVALQSSLRRGGFPTRRAAIASMVGGGLVLGLTAYWGTRGRRTTSTEPSPEVLLDPSRPELIAEWTVTRPPVASLAIAPESDKLFVTTYSSFGTVFELRTGKALWEYPVEAVEMPTLSNNGQWVAYCHNRYDVEKKRWTTARISIYTATENNVAAEVFELPRERVESLAWSPDDQFLLAGCWYGRLALLNRKARGTVWEFESEHRPLCVAFDPTGRFVAYGDTNAFVGVRAASEGALVWYERIHRNNTLHVSFDPTGEQVISASRDRELCWTDARTGRVVRTVQDFRQRVGFAVASADRKRVVTLGLEHDPTNVLQPSEVHVWDVVRGERVWTHPEPLAAAPKATLSPDGTVCAVGYQDGHVRVWAVATRN